MRRPCAVSATAKGHDLAVAQPTYHTSALVLKKTKLGESDLIITFLSDDGSLFQGVAKGARKPTSSFASRLEMYAQTDLLMVEGKSLDIVKEARLVQANEHLRTDYDASCVAAVIAELLSKTALADQPHPVHFAMATRAFAMLKDADQLHGSLLTCAFIMKCVSSIGYRPSLDTCVTCGDAIDIERLSNASTIGFSYAEGGIVCENCSQLSRETAVDSAFILWLRALLFATFDDLIAAEADAATISRLKEFLLT